MTAGTDRDGPFRFLPRTAQGDIDGVVGDELLIQVDCDGYRQVLALKVDGGRVDVLGYVLSTPHDGGFVIEAGEDAIRVEGGIVLVTLRGPIRPDRQSVVDKQVRGTGDPREPVVLEQRNIGAFLDATKVEADGAQFKITVGGQAQTYQRTGSGTWEKVS